MIFNSQITCILGGYYYYEGCLACRISLHVCDYIYVTYVVLLICVCDMYAGIIDLCVVGPTSIPSGRCLYVDFHSVFPIGIRGKGIEHIYL